MQSVCIQFAYMQSVCMQSWSALWSLHDLQEVDRTVADHPCPPAFFFKCCDDHQCQLCLISSITAGWGKKQGMSHPHPFELLFKFNYLRTNSKLSDYSVWLNKLCLKLGYGVGPKLPHVVQPPKAIHGITTNSPMRFQYFSMMRSWKMKIARSDYP